MDKKNPQNKKPFFARLLEEQELETVTGAVAVEPTRKYPSDTDEDATLKYPSDGDDLDIG